MSETNENNAQQSTRKHPEMPPQGHLREMGIVDLRSAKTAADLQGITGISEVGCVLIPEHLAMELAKIPMAQVGSVVPIPEGDNIQTQLGQIKLTGEALAGGDPENVLLVIGQMFITTPVTSVGYKEIWVHGQLLALRGSEGVLGAKMTRIQGQTLYLPAKARILMGDESIGGAFLELLSEPQCLVMMGNLTFEDDVTPELLKAKIPEIVLMGEIVAPAALIPLLKVLTVEKMGNIRAKE